MLHRMSWSALTVAVVIALGCGTAAGAVVDAYPSPGTQFASPKTQLSFRGVAPSAIRVLSVTGSVTGAHGGHVVADSDGHGGSFIPDRPFAQGETVTVRTSMPVHLGQLGAYTIKIATQGPPIVPSARNPPLVLHGPGLQYFHSRHDLHPAMLTASAAHGPTASGDLFVGLFPAPFQTGPGQNGAAIFDTNARLIWFHPMPAGQVALDVKVQQYEGKPVLTWWQGFVNVGVGVGTGRIFDTSYRQIATVSAGNGYGADPHEFKLTPRNTALVDVENPVVQDLSSIHGSKRAVVLDSVLQEIDVKTGLVLFEWHSLDHVAVADSYNPLPTGDGHVDDYFHINSLDDTPDGNFLVSSRNTWAVYKVSRADGHVEWRLGGKHSSFKMLRGTTFAWQHDARVQSDGTITLFDDEAAPAHAKTSRGIGIGLDTHAHRAWLRRDYRPSPPTLANSQGNVQVLPTGNVLVGWGASPYITEYSKHGAVMRLYTYARGEESYRAYRFPWNPQPLSKPAVAASTGGGRTQVYMSWNGAANVASWEVLAGSSASALKPVATATSAGFETSASVAAAPFVAVQARDAHGTVLSTSAAIAPNGS